MPAVDGQITQRGASIHWCSPGCTRARFHSATPYLEILSRASRFPRNIILQPKADNFSSPTPQLSLPLSSTSIVPSFLPFVLSFRSFLSFFPFVLPYPYPLPSLIPCFYRHPLNPRADAIGNPF
jgi:hypothetical protein